MRVDVNLLGPLEATLNNVSVVPSAAKARQLWAVLALNAGHVVPGSTLVNEIRRRAFQRLRTSMVEEFSVDPSVGTQRLHESVLRGDPDFDPSDGTTLDAVAG